MKVGKYRKKWDIKQIAKCPREEMLIGWALECEDYILFRPCDPAKGAILCDVIETEERSLKAAMRVVLWRIKLAYKEETSDIFTMSQPDVVF